MKTGRLLKFHRPGGDIQVYLYQEADETRAAIYVMSSDRDREPAWRIAGPTSEVVEAEARAWIEAHFPRA